MHLVIDEHVLLIKSVLL